MSDPRAPRIRQATVDLILYTAASAAALAVDMLIMVVLANWLHVHYLLAAAAGFLAGLLVVYKISVLMIFSGRRKIRADLEFAGFAGVGIVGLILNEILIFVFVEYGSLPLVSAKVATVGLVFLFNFVARRQLLFS